MSPPSPEQMDRDLVLTALGYQPERLPWKPIDMPEDKSLCHRCSKKVYPVEKINIGVLYHKGCFKCYTCGILLTLKTFYKHAQSNNKEIYCNQHVPKQSSYLDADALEIQNALKAQQKQQTKNQGMELEEGWSYNEHQSAGYQHLRRPKTGQKKLKRRSTLRTSKDFEKFGVYDAQSDLEKVHRQEEDELYQEIFKDRKEKIHELEQGLRKERERTIRELIRWFDEKGTSAIEREDGVNKVESYFRRQREERIRDLLQRLGLDEQAAVTRMVEKHAQEMLELIAQKDYEAASELKRQSLEQGIDPSLLEDILYSEDTQEESEGFTDQDTQTDDELEEGSKFRGQKVNVGHIDTQTDDDSRFRAETMRSHQDTQTDDELEEESNVRGHKVSRGHQDTQTDDELEERSNSRSQKVKRGYEGTSTDVTYRERDVQTDRQKLERTDASSNLRKYTTTSTSDDYENNEDEGYGDKENQNECVSDVAVTRKKYRHKKKTDQHTIPGIYVDDNSRVKDHSKRGMSPAMKKLKDTLEMSINKERTPVRAAQGHHNIHKSYDSPPQTHSPYARRKPKPPVLSIARPPSQNSPAHQRSDQGIKVKSHSTPSCHEETRSEMKGQTSTGEMHGSNQQKVPAYEIHFTVPGNHPNVQVIRKPSPNVTQTDVNANDESDEDEDDDENDDESDETDETDESEEEDNVTEESSNEEGEYDTKAAGNLLRHPADDSKLKIKVDKDILRNKSKSKPSNIEESNDSSEYEDEKRDEVPGIHVVPMVPSGALVGIPRVLPPKNRKSTLYESEEVFEQFDNQAIQEAQKDHKTFTDLVRRLSKKCQTELQKVRALFRWITVKDLNKLDLDGPLNPDSPMGLLRGIKSGKESYHTLFKRLCSYAGLHCVIIDGYSKGAGYRPGSRFKGQTFRNQWTAVNVEGSWRFINCNWGARHVKGPRDQTLTYKCDEFYFLTDPEDHIYQHFPDEQDWQLLKKPITLDDFVKLPVTKSPFYSKHLQFAYKYQAVFQVTDGTSEIRLISPKFMNFAAKLINKEKKVPEEVLAERSLVRSIGNEVVIMVNLPMTGVYYLDVFVESDWIKTQMDHACSFALRCTGVSRDAHVSYPQIGMYGPTWLFREMGLSEDSHVDPYIKCRQQVSVTISTARDVKISHTFQLWSYRDRQLQDQERFALLKSRNAHSSTFLLSCTNKGHYILTVFGEDSASEKKAEVLYRYVIDCRIAAQDARPFPRVSKRWQHCELIEPLQGDLPMDAQVVFKISSETASELVVVVHGTWYSLQNNNGIWQGIIPTGTQQGKALVYAKYGATTGKSKYIPCLEYNILSLRQYSFV